MRRDPYLRHQPHQPEPKVPVGKNVVPIVKFEGLLEEKVVRCNVAKGTSVFAPGSAQRHGRTHRPQANQIRRECEAKLVHMGFISEFT